MESGQAWNADLEEPFLWAKAGSQSGPIPLTSGNPLRAY
jgi:hypothetical protein